MVEKLCGPDRISARELSRRVGVSDSTLSRWRREAMVTEMTESNESSKSKKRPRRPQDWSAEQRLWAVTEASGMTEEELGVFLRREGLRTTDLERWRKTLLEALDPKADKRARKRRRAHSKQIRELKKELDRKEKALAETAALLALKKKPARSGGTRTTTLRRGATHGARADR